MRLKKIKDLSKQIAEWTSKRTAFRAKWQKEKELLDNIQAKRKEIDGFKLRAEQLERDGKYGEVAEIRYGKIKAAQDEVKILESTLQNINSESRLLKEEVDAEDIAEIVSKWTGIQIDKLLEGERQKVLSMEKVISTKVIGQKEAITSVSNAVRRSKAGIQDPNRPLGSFLFLGPTGVGKTELSKALASFLFDDQNAMIRIDMSEYMEKHSVSRLIGAPPGYVGYDQGGALTEAVRRRPYQVILFDEVEKAHPDVFNIFLQILDDGRLTDGQGRVVDFKNTIIILTSNLGSEFIQADFLS